MTKEKVLLLLIAITMLIIAILPNTVKAETGEEKWTDFSKATYEFENLSENNFSDYVLRVKNVEFNNESVYYMFFSPTKDKPQMGDRIENNTGPSYLIGRELRDNAQAVIEKGEEKSIIDRLDMILEKNGEILYLWIIEEYNANTNTPEYNEVVSAQEVQKPKQYEIGHRISGYFFPGYTDMIIHETTTLKSDGYRKVKLKIGKVNDKDILLSIKNKESNCLEKLMSYAKSTNSIYEITIPYGTSNTITDKFEVVVGDYYYVYMEADDENGIYRKIEDVGLYYGHSHKYDGIDNDKDLLSYSSDEFNWDNISLIDNNDKTIIKDDKEKDKIEVIENKEKNGTTDNTVVTGNIPKAGEKAIYMVIVLAVTLTMIGCIKYKQYKDI